MEKAKRNISLRADNLSQPEIAMLERQLYDWSNLGYSTIAMMYFIEKGYKRKYHVSATYENDDFIFDVK